MVREVTPDRVLGASEERSTSEDCPLADATSYSGTADDARLVYDLSDDPVELPKYFHFDVFPRTTASPFFGVTYVESDPARGVDTFSSGVVNRAMDRLLGTDERLSNVVQCLGGATARVQFPTTYDRPRAGWQLIRSSRRSMAKMERVHEIEIAIERAQQYPLVWEQTPVRITDDPPDPEPSPVATDGVLVDELGQSTKREWDGKTRSVDDLEERLESQRVAREEWAWPDSYSRWGGWVDRQFDAPEFFDVGRDGDRWWFVDPDGHPFWSSGLNCVAPEERSVVRELEDALEWIPPQDGRFSDAITYEDGDPVVHFVSANFARIYGPDEWRDAWSDVTHGHLERAGFNTVGCWSDSTVAREYGVPYTRNLPYDTLRTPRVGLEFPDVYHPEFPAHADEYAEPLADTADDPLVLGYFLGNYADWTLGALPARAMLHDGEWSHSRAELVEFLDERYGTDERLQREWDMDVSFETLSEGTVHGEVTSAAERDLREFSERMIGRYYRTVSEACSRHDPNHLNLGTRFSGIPEDFVLSNLDGVDVLTSYCYRSTPAERYEAVSERHDLPVLFGEWQVGAADVGLPSAGLCAVDTQSDRADGYRGFVEAAATSDWCVGTHYFKLYDDPVIGRDTGENANTGLLDVCNRPYLPMLDAARTVHERMYDLRTGRIPPVDVDVSYIEDI